MTDIHFNVYIIINNNMCLYIDMYRQSIQLPINYMVNNFACFIYCLTIKYNE